MDYWNYPLPFCNSIQDTINSVIVGKYLDNNPKFDRGTLDRELYRAQVATRETTKNRLEYAHDIPSTNPLLRPIKLTIEEEE